MILKLFRAIDRASSCARKVRYGHAETAETARLHMQRKTGEALEVYKCRHCDGWHVGHRRGHAD